MTVFIVKSPKPRNPLVAAARFRRAGKHAADAGNARRAGRKALKNEIATLDLPRTERARPPSV